MTYRARNVFGVVEKHAPEVKELRRKTERILADRPRGKGVTEKQN